MVNILKIILIWVFFKTRIFFRREYFKNSSIYCMKMQDRMQNTPLFPYFELICQAKNHTQKNNIFPTGVQPQNGKLSFSGSLAKLLLIGWMKSSLGRPHLSNTFVIRYPTLSDTNPVPDGFYCVIKINGFTVDWNSSFDFFK